MHTVPFDDRNCLDAKLVGGKGYGLAGMAQAGIPVAPGFVASTKVYREYLIDTGLQQLLEHAVKSPDTIGLSRTATEIQDFFLATALPNRLSKMIADAYALLSASVGVQNVPVAVRSNATAEDAIGASFAGEYETYVGISGFSQVEHHIRRCWASAFTDRAVSYAAKMGLSAFDIQMAVVVQKGVNARAAGVMFTLSPVTGDRSRIIIEASYGLGLSVVGGEVTPDRFVVSKIEDAILERTLGDKRVEYLIDQTSKAVEVDRLQRLCLSDSDVLALAQLGKKLERLHGCSQDIEFAIDGDLPEGENIILLQCRPETTWSGKSRRNEKETPLSVAAGMFARAGRS
jgi:pyruvate, water dikinase